MHPGVRWAAGIGMLVAYDVWCARNDTPGDSLSEVTRDLLRTHTPLGRAVFLGIWTGLTTWFLPHILKAATPVPTPAGHHR